MEWFETALFYSFAIILVGSALCVVMARNPVHSVLFLVLSFFTGAALWLMLQAEFLAMILMLVYVGAVMVLFLFVVMMVDIDMTTLKHIAMQNLAAAAVVGALIVLEMGAVIFRGFCHIGRQVPETAAEIGLTAEIGKSLFTGYLYQVELAAMLLLVALVGAVVLTLRRRTDARYTSAGEAVKVNPSDRIRLVEMEAEKMAGNNNGTEEKEP
ncbi:MAG: NADH-quinone oxidoreductase subunit J [Oxalobacter sp.]|nr:NADH-quinone oxidoreductase subunit J [Oxalobacter sp.]